MPTDRKIQVSDIMEWKTQKSVRAFILDHIAIENSYDHITWEKTLKNSFGIEIFEDEKEKQLFESLNLCRNMIAHSGGKTNSKVVRELKRIFNKKENESELFKIEKWDIFDEKIFNLLKHLTSRIIDRIEKNNA
tara:strand:- start:735 stop:1136 length:402 start_codon:yes stop_codon:yes gene_type:complete